MLLCKVNVMLYIICCNSSTNLPYSTTLSSPPPPLLPTILLTTPELGELVGLVLCVVRVTGADEGVKSFVNKIAPHIIRAVFNVAGKWGTGVGCTGLQLGRCGGYWKEPQYTPFLVHIYAMRSKNGC